MPLFDEELFTQLNEILTRWLKTEGECFAAFLLQTYAWWQHDQMMLGLDVERLTPMVIHEDPATIFQVVNNGNDYDTFALVNLPSIFQREYEDSGRDIEVVHRTRKEVQREATAQGISEVEVLLTHFRAERAYLADFLRVQLRQALKPEE